MTAKKNRYLTVIVVAVLLLAGLLYAVWPDPFPTPEPMTFRWTPPTTGAVAVRYDVEIHAGVEGSDEVISTTVTEPEVTFDVEWVKLYRIRVRGVDQLGRAGEWSEYSLSHDRELDDPPSI
ncbi:hypothetical protein KDM41_05605 [bacterium]|nr:hypothetical protein [bacterium]